MKKIESEEKKCTKEYPASKLGMPHGAAHWSWKGGVSYYPNHSELKRIRKAKLADVNYCCQIKSPVCTGKATVTHHADGSKNNHSWDNLVPCCTKCHGYVSRGRKNRGIAKTRHGGLTIDDWATKTGLSASTIHRFFVGNEATKKTRLIMQKYYFEFSQKSEAEKILERLEVGL